LPRESLENADDAAGHLAFESSSRVAKNGRVRSAVAEVARRNRLRAADGNVRADSPGGLMSVSASQIRGNRQHGAGGVSFFGKPEKS